MTEELQRYHVIVRFPSDRLHRLPDDPITGFCDAIEGLHYRRLQGFHKPDDILKVSKLASQDDFIMHCRLIAPATRSEIGKINYIIRKHWPSRRVHAGRWWRVIED